MQNTQLKLTYDKNSHEIQIQYENAEISTFILISDVNLVEKDKWKSFRDGILSEEENDSSCLNFGNCNGEISLKRKQSCISIVVSKCGGLGGAAMHITTFSSKLFGQHFVDFIDKNFLSD